MTAIFCKISPWRVCTNLINRHACSVIPDKHQQLLKRREARKLKREQESQMYLDNLDEVSAGKAKAIQLEYLDYFYFNAPHLDDTFKSLSATEVKRLLTEMVSESERTSYYRHLLSKAESKLTKKEAKRIFTDEVYRYMVQPYRNIATLNRHRAVCGYLYGNPVVLDCGYKVPSMYTGLVNVEIGKCYKSNTIHHQPCQLHLTGLQDNLTVTEEFSEGGALEHLFVHRHDECFMDVFPHHRLTYLTPDAPPLTDYDGDRIYVIGGLLDRESNNQSLAKAKQYGITYASLPLGKYVRFNDGWARKTLAIHEVLGLLLDMGLTHQWRFSIKKNISLSSYLPSSMIEALEDLDSETERQHYLWKVYNSC